MSAGDEVLKIAVEGNTLTRLDELERAIIDLRAEVLSVQQLDNLTSEAGSQTFGTSTLDAEGIHTSANLVDVNVFYAATPPSDALSNIIYCAAHDSVNHFLYIGGAVGKLVGKIGGVLADGIVKYDLRKMEFSDAGIVPSGVISDLGAVYAIVVDSAGRVYFTFRPSVGAAIEFGVWDGSFTSIPAGGTYGYDEYSLGVDSNDNVYVVRFETVGVFSNARFLSKYDGSAFTNVADIGITKIMYAIHVGADDLVYFGGAQTTIGGDTARVFVYDGSTVAGLDDTLDGDVLSLWKDADTGALYAGGSMTGYLWAYDGAAWSQVTDELDGAVRGVVGKYNNLYLCGDMTNYAAVYDGSALSQFGNGAFNDTAYCVVEADGNVWIGGEFDEFDGFPARAAGVLIRTLASALRYLTPRYVPVQSNGDISLDGNTVADLLKLDASANTITLLASALAGLTGVYTPTLYNTTNIAASTAFECHYVRVGGFVIVGGQVAIDPTAAGAIELGISLPIASALTAISELTGTAATQGVNQSARVYADATNDRALLATVAVDGANRAYSFIFMYRVL